MNTYKRNSSWSFVIAMGFALLPLMNISASAQTIAWSRQFGSASVDYGFSTDVDASGNVYVAGWTDGALPGQINAGNDDAFVRKYGANGNELWTRQFGTPGFDSILDIAVDGTGVYVAGEINGNGMNSGDSDAFVRKYDVNGNEMWNRQFGTAALDIASSITVDAISVYVAGRTRGVFPDQINAGGDDIFVRKYDANGNEFWTRQFGTSGFDEPRGIAIDVTGIYMAGITGGAFPGQVHAGSADAFVRKCDMNGTELWTHQFGTPVYDYADGISVHATGVYVAGATEDALPSQISAGAEDTFVRKYDTSGNEVWTRQFGTSSADEPRGYGISVDATGVYVAGYSGGTFPGQINAGGMDAFVRKYGLNGDEQWTNQFGTPVDDVAYGILAGTTGVFVAGRTSGTLPSQTSAGGIDAFLAKFGPLNQPLTISSDQPTAATNEGQIATNTGTMSVPDGDAVTLTSSAGTIINNNDGTWAWTFTTSDGPAQSQIVTITADDGNGGLAQTSFALTVNNVAPSVSAVAVPVNPINLSSQPVSVSASFNDPAGINDEPYICTIDFGDGSGPQAGTISGMTCSGSHTYSSAGVYVVTITITDKDNDSGSASATNFVVIYDPSAGFVTGGGWIDSPPGAYVANPTLVGKANFGFVSKYQKGKSIPDGNTTFHFNTVNFKFKSTSYEWLIIAGPKAQYKGQGTVNNSGNYGFLLFARDGQINGGGGVDKFRIKIWDKNNGDAVVYDNQMGDADNDEASDVIEGGSIEIHSSSAKAVAGEDVANAPQDFALRKNYPNPFNSSTTFAFDLPKDSQVKLTIYSITGQFVATVVNGDLNAGHYTFVWQAPAELPSGAYLYKLEAPDFTSTRKLVFLK